MAQVPSLVEVLTMLAGGLGVGADGDHRDHHPPHPIALAGGDGAEHLRRQGPAHASLSLLGQRGAAGAALSSDQQGPGTPLHHLVVLIQ